ncbi:hypothetical protein FKM82_016986 [Ascaphus truei]
MVEGGLLSGIEWRLRVESLFSPVYLAEEGLPHQSQKSHPASGQAQLPGLGRWGPLGATPLPPVVATLKLRPSC